MTISRFLGLFDTSVYSRFSTVTVQCFIEIEGDIFTCLSAPQLSRLLCTSALCKAAIFFLSHIFIWLRNMCGCLKMNIKY